MSNTATELEKMILNGQIVRIEVSKLNLDNEFMSYKPETSDEEDFKAWLTEIIKNGLKDFYRPICDPAFNDDMTGICYEFGKKPAVGKSYNWWTKVAKEFNSSCRLGTPDEYIAFLGVFIKKLIKNGWSISDAWKAVCTQSKNLGHCKDSKNAKNSFETTGMRGICGFYDLGNTYKILANYEDMHGFWIAGAYYGYEGSFNPIAGIDCSIPWHKRDDNLNSAVGWIVSVYDTDY